MSCWAPFVSRDPRLIGVGFAESRPLSYPPRACDQENVKLQGQVKSKEGELQEQAGQKHLNVYIYICIHIYTKLVDHFQCFTIKFICSSCF